MSLVISFGSLYFLRSNLDANEFGQLIFITTVAVTFATFSSLGADNLFANMMSFPNFSTSIDKAGQTLLFVVVLLTCVASPIYIYSYSSTQNLFTALLFTASVATYRVFGGISVYRKRLSSHYFFSVYGPLLILALLSFILKEKQNLLWCASAIMLLALVLRPLRPISFGWSNQSLQIKNLFLVGKTGAPIVLVTFFVGNLEVLDLKFTNIFFGNAASGDVALIHRVSSLILIALAAWNIPAIMEFQNIAREAKRDEIWRRYVEITFSIVKVTSIILLFLVVSRDQIFTFFAISSSYIIPFWILLLGKFFSVLVGPTGVALIQLGYQWYFVLISALVFTLKFCVLYAATVFELLTLGGVFELVCISALATFFLNLLGLIIIVRKYRC